MTSGVYLIRCIPTEKVYVGSSVNIIARWSQHKCDLKAKRHHSTKLQRAWDKYGASSFEFSVIEENCSELIQAEQKWIDSFNAFNSGLNCRPIADRFGNETPKDKSVRVRMSDAQLEKVAKWAEAYGLGVSTFIADKLVDQLPDEPPQLPQPPVKP